MAEKFYWWLVLTSFPFIKLFEIWKVSYEVESSQSYLEFLTFFRVDDKIIAKQLRKWKKACLSLFAQKVYQNRIYLCNKNFCIHKKKLLQNQVFWNWVFTEFRKKIGNFLLKSATGVSFDAFSFHWIVSNMEKQSTKGQGPLYLICLWSWTMSFIGSEFMVTRPEVSCRMAISSLLRLTF